MDYVLVDTMLKTTITTLEQLKDAPGQHFARGLPEILQKLGNLGFEIKHDAASHDAFLEQVSGGEIRGKLCTIYQAF